MRQHAWQFGCFLLACAAEHVAAQAPDFSTRIPHAHTEMDVGFLPLAKPAAGPWNRDDLERVTRFQWTWSGHELSALEFRPIDAAAASQPLEVVEVEYMRFLWTGDSWYSVCASQQSYVIDRSPRLNPMTDFLSAFNLFDWSLFSAPDGLRKAFTNDRVLSQSENDSIRRVRISRNSNDSLQLEVAYDKTRNRVNEILAEVFRNDDESPEPLLAASVRFSVIEWVTVDGVDVPQRAIRESRNFLDAQLGTALDEPRVQRIGIVRRSLDVLSQQQVDRRLFEPPPAPMKTAVVDTRQRISYVVGDRFMLVDGNMFETPTAIERVIEPEELANLLKNSKPSGE